MKDIHSQCVQYGTQEDGYINYVKGANVAGFLKVASAMLDTMQFLNPWLLLGLLAVAIPVAVHLFNFRRYRKLYFSNVKFLKELKQQTRKQSNLLHRLVLASRILAFIFIVLAFAQPFFAAKDAAPLKSSNIVSVFVDNSFSMEAQGTRGTLLDEAKDKAGELAAAYQQDDQFQLLTNDFEGRHQRLVSRDEFITMLNEVEVSSAVRSLKEIAARQNDLLQANSSETAIVHYISDFQKSTILKTLPDSGISKGYLIPLKAATTNNLFIDSCWFSNPVLQVNEQATLTVRITNVSESRLEKIPVRLMIENAQRSVASVDIDAGASQEISFSFTNNKPGSYSGLVEINDFPVTYDDNYYFTYSISPAIPVLCINNDTPDPYITSVFKVDSIIRLTNTPVRQIDLSSFPSFRLIIIDRLNDLSTGLMQELVKYAENGGSIIIIPSFDAQLDEQNQLLSSLGADIFTGINDSPVKLAKVNTSHPLYKEVFEQGSMKADNIDYPIINKHFGLVVSSGSTAETLLELANGQAMLALNTFGAGKVYSFTTDISTETGNFARHALFVPTMLNIAFRSEKISPLMYYTDVLTPIPVIGTFSSSDNVIKLAKVDDEYNFIPEFRQINGRNYIFINGQVPKAGFYKVTSNNQDIDLLAFNYNRKESILGSATDDDLDQITERTGLVIIENSPKPLDKIINKQGGENKFWKWFVIAALLSLTAEVFLLAFFKRRTTTV
jgi:hypothetical protein